MRNHDVQASLSKRLASTHATTPSEGSVGCREWLESAIAVELVSRIENIRVGNALSTSVHFPSLYGTVKLWRGYS